MKKTTLHYSSYLTVFLLSWFLTGCADFLASPFTDQLESTGSDFNLTQKNKLLSNPAAIIPAADLETLSLALLSDNHQNYNDLEEVVARVNERIDLDFLVHTGDMTDNGYNFEYDAFIRSITQVQIPSFVVIGNHDAIGKGRKIFKNYFGDYNYSVTYRGYHFIFFNNNRLEFLDENWNLDWLAQELTQHPELPKLVFQHINTENHEAFTAAQSAQMKSLYETHNVHWVINGHRHVFSFVEASGVRYLQIPRIEGARYVVLKLGESQFEIQQCKGVSCENTHQGPTY